MRVLGLSHNPLVATTRSSIALISRELEQLPSLQLSRRSETAQASCGLRSSSASLTERACQSISWD